MLFSETNLAWLRGAWQKEQIIPLVSRATVDELLRVLQYPKFKLTAEEIESLLADFLPWAEVVEVGEIPSDLPTLSDPDDLKFLALAVVAQADVLISGDKHILAAKDKLAAIPILNLSEFKQKLMQR